MGAARPDPSVMGGENGQMSIFFSWRTAACCVSYWS